MAENFDYKKLTMKEMVEFIKTYHNDDASKKAFRANCIIKVKEQETVFDIDENGNKIVEKNKNGKEYYKKKRVDKKGGKMIEQASMFSAKKYFYDTYKEDANIIWSNTPSKGKKKSAVDEVWSW